jgi:putative spermidine/putrescine transport system substrate-binding protein
MRASRRSAGRLTERQRQGGEKVRRRIFPSAAFTAGAFALGVFAFAALALLPGAAHAQGGSLKVGTYGGYFQESFEKHIFPEFTKETGIEIESIGEPTGEAWLVQLQQAARAGQAPADVSMMAQVARLRGEKAGLWAPLDPEKIPNLKNLPEHFVHRYPNGDLYGTGAVSWYITLVTNTEAYPQAPESWQALWDPANEDRLGLLALASNSFLLEITATTFFDGTEILGTEEGVMQVLEKLAEAKPNVRLWYRDEGQFQQALETGEIPMGQYYHDVTGLAAAEGKPVRSTFPAEGAVLDSGSWVVSKASDKLEEAQIFIDYMARPEIQAKLSRFVGTAPTVPRELTDLTEEEFNAVASDKEPILPQYELYIERGDWVNQKWSEMITG